MKEKEEAEEGEEKGEEANEGSKVMSALGGGGVEWVG